MKKGIINGLILTASFIAAGMFTSCKDTYQDYRTEFQSQIDYQASVSETLKGQVNTLNEELATLKALQKECQENCAKKFEEMNAKINALQALVDKVKADSEAADANLQAQITNLVNEIAKQQNEIDALKEEIAALKAQDALFQSAIDTINNTIAEVKAQVATNTKNIADLVDAVDAVNKAAAAAAALAQEALDLAGQNKTDIAALQEAVQTINNTIAGWGDRLTAVEKEAAAAMAKATANEARIKALEELTTKQAEAIATLKSSLEGLTTTVGGLSTTVEGLKNGLSTLENTVTALAQKMAEAEVTINEYALQFAQALLDLEAAKELLAQVNALATEAKTMAQEALSQNEALSGRMTAAEDEIKAVKEAYAKADQQMQSDIAKLQDAVSKLQSKIEELSSKYEKALGELITSIIIQGTWNPIYGEMAAPLDVRSNVLAALYGNAVNDVYFPTDKPSCYVDADDVPTFTEGDIEILNGFNTFWFDAQDVVIDEAEGNAGTLYLTVNPSDVDFTDTQFSLVNSLDEESGVKLSSLKPSDHLLTYGWNRAENGFYEAKATIAADDIESVKVVFDLEEAKDVIKELRNVTNGIHTVNHTDIYSTLQDALSAILEADGVKATWTDAVSGQPKSVYSQYGIAATAIKPLSFAFLKDWDAPKLPHISPFDYTIDMKLDYADYKDVPYSTLTVKIDTNGDGVYETYTIQGVNELIDNINENVGGSLVTDIDELIDQIAGQVNKNVDKVLNTVNNKVISRVNSLIDNLNHRISIINHYLQPCLIYQANDGTYFQTSSTWYAPTHFTLEGEGEQAILLTPTSYTAELLAPAFKKLVAVTNVYNADFTASAQDGDATCKEALEKANNAEGMNVIYNGASDILFLTDSKYAGCVYEILYTAVDYSGKVVANKYYVKVVE